MKPNLVEAEAQASKLLDGWWTTPTRDAPLPVDPIEMAERLGIRVNTDDLPVNQSGNIVFQSDHFAVITLNRADHPNRRRFTCAHEIGHFVRRREGHGSNRFVDYRDTLAGLGQDPEEIFANQFAAAMLMPAHLVQRFKNEDRTPEHMAQKFGTSTQAIQLRLRNLGLE